jgi:hypothetical protein
LYRFQKCSKICVEHCQKRSKAAFLGIIRETFGLNPGPPLARAGVVKWLKMIEELLNSFHGFEFFDKLILEMNQLLSNFFVGKKLN